MTHDRVVRCLVLTVWTVSWYKTPKGMPVKRKGKSKGKKKAKSKKGKKKKGKKRDQSPAPEGSISLDDFELPIRSKVDPPTLYESFHTLPTVDSFFGRFLVGVETDDRFDEFLPKGNDTLNLALQQQNSTNKPRASTSSSMTQAKSINKETNTESKETGVDDLPGMDYDVPISWKQRVERSQRVPMEADADGSVLEVFLCTECEETLATHLCEDCGQQMYCEYCANFVHRTRRNGLVGHAIVVISTITELPYIENF